MTPDPEHPERPASDPSVFGNLPSARPGVRSPRRDAGKRKPSAPKRAEAKAAKPKPPPRRPEPRPAPPPRRPAAAPPQGGRAAERPPEQKPGSSRGIEDVAWAGITVAAEAATLGVRLFSRALEAVRERR